ncbi:hypothetical protein [Methylophaga nitratireducenticrescens]|uniref:hypothetical protein n=1 Tax=Methylophaga nitratireducenticrescens TaxID=754476 RepID=UPI000CDC4E84|nr:hypothetical protein [Methylophaga nitratireducenticrescens]AUZ85143.1 hypothetical protein CDW43_11440 [Methylophaga nitratireducenticrescens]
MRKKRPADLVTFAPSALFTKLAESDDENLERVNEGQAGVLDDLFDLTGSPIGAAIHAVSALEMAAETLSPRDSGRVVITSIRSKDENEMEGW